MFKFKSVSQHWLSHCNAERTWCDTRTQPFTGWDKRSTIWWEPGGLLWTLTLVCCDACSCLDPVKQFRGEPGKAAWSVSTLFLLARSKTSDSHSSVPFNIRIFSVCSEWLSYLPSFSWSTLNRAPPESPSQWLLPVSSYVHMWKLKWASWFVC